MIAKPDSDNVNSPLLNFAEEHAKAHEYDIDATVAAMVRRLTADPGLERKLMPEMRVIACQQMVCRLRGAENDRTTTEAISEPSATAGRLHTPGLGPGAGTAKGAERFAMEARLNNRIYTYKKQPKPK